MTGSHRSGTARRRLVALVLAAALGRGYVGRHRLAAAALGRPVTETSTTVRASAAPAPTSRQSVAPRLSVVRTPTRHDLAVDSVLTSTILADVLLGDRVIDDTPQTDTQVADTKPHPVVTLLPLPVTTADDAVYAAVDAERDEQATAELADGTGGYLARHRPRHTA